MAASRPLTGDRLPVASITRSAWTTVAPPMVTPATCGTPAIASCPVTRPVTATPRQMVRPSVCLATRATAASSTGRRPVTVSKRSSPSRLPPVISSGRTPSMLVRTPPSVSSPAITSGSSRSITARQRGSMKCSWRNWFTPRRSHRCHRSPARPRGPAASRSRTVTWCPSRASSIPAVRPLSPPPITTICATCPPLVLLVVLLVVVRQAALVGQRPARFQQRLQVAQNPAPAAGSGRLGGRERGCLRGSGTFVPDGHGGQARLLLVDLPGQAGGGFGRGPGVEHRVPGLDEPLGRFGFEHFPADDQFPGTLPVPAPAGVG